MVEAYKPLYTAKQVSQILLVNVATVYELMNKGQLPYLILGKGMEAERFEGAIWRSSSKARNRQNHKEVQNENMDH